MADISDVEEAMVAIIANSLQLGQNYLPGSAVLSPVAKVKCEVYRGWPIASHLAPALQQGVCTVSVFPVPGSSRRATRYFPQWTSLGEPPATLTATVSGNTVTIGGSPSTSQTVGIRYGSLLAASVASYRPVVGDTVNSVASALGALIAGASVSGAMITMPANQEIDAAVAADQTAWMETRRQEQNIWVIGWCNTPATRDNVVKAVDGGFASLLDASGNLTDQFPLSDGSSARILYISSHTDDQAQRSGIWRRDLRYVVNYPTTITQIFPTLLFASDSNTEQISETVSTVTTSQDQE